MPGWRLWEAGNTCVLATAVGIAVLMVARVASAAPVSIWYRTTDGCPSAEAFIARVSQQGVEARVARVGDHIDFVVTLGREESQASAILERQTSESTVALREVHAATCEAAANAVALTLALTAGPAAAPPSKSAENQAGQPREGATPEVTTTEISGIRPSEQAVRDAGRSPHPGARRDPPVWFAGAQGSLGSLVSGSALWGGNAFVGVQAQRGWQSSARVSFVSGFSNGPVPDLSLTILAARLEGCPAAWGGVLSVMGCVALDLGSLRGASNAPGGASDTSLWSALWGLARLQYRPAGSRFGAEMQGGVTTALTRYSVTAGTPPEPLAEVRPWSVGLALGASARWP